MKIGELMALMSCKYGDELYITIKEILSRYGISIYDEYGMIKDLYVLCCDVAEVLDKGK